MASRVAYGRVALTVIGGMPGREIGVVTGIPGILGCVIAEKKFTRYNFFGFISLYHSLMEMNLYTK